jgi:transposase
MSDVTPQGSYIGMNRIADQVDLVIGVDTHTDTHSAAVLDRLGGIRAELRVPADRHGYQQLLELTTAHLRRGERVCWAVEGTRSHGQGLTRHLRAAGQWVIEAPAPAASTRRRGGKSDRLDAVAAARAVLARPAHTAAIPRADGDREAARILLTVRRHHTDTRTATVNLLKSLILTAADELREQLRGRSTAGQVRWLATHTAPADTDRETRTRHQQLHQLATEIRRYDTQLRANERDLTTLMRRLCPALLALRGVGPITAAVAYTAWSHPGRVRNDAAYANLAGVAPIPASSGRNHRHRLNRGGDRHLNAAVWIIATTRRRCDPATRAYVQRRTSQGLSSKDITRCLKRYIARELYRTITAHAATTAA